MKHRWKLAITTALLAAASFASAHPSVGIVQDKRGNVYYTDTKKVVRIAPDGRVSIVVPDVHTHELALDTDDSLYGEHLSFTGASNKWRHRVWRMKADGSVSDVIPERDGFLQDYSFARDGSGSMYWADRAATSVTIRKRDAKGTTTPVASNGLRAVQRMAAAKDGTLFLMDAGDLRRISPTGALTTVAAKVSNQIPPPASVSTPHYQMGVYAAADGSVYVAVSEERLVLKVAADGKRTVAARSQPSWAPSGCLIDREGRLWMLEYQSNNDMRVVRIESDGRQTPFSVK